MVIYYDKPNTTPMSFVKVNDILEQPVNADFRNGDMIEIKTHYLGFVRTVVQET